MESKSVTSELTPALIREALGYSKTDAARGAQFGLDTLATLERGESVRVKTVRDLAEFYGIPTAKLVEAMENVRGAA